MYWATWASRDTSSLLRFRRDWWSLQFGGTCDFRDVSKSHVFIRKKVRSKSFRLVGGSIIGGLTWYRDDERFLIHPFGRRNIFDNLNRGGTLLC